MSEKFSRTEMLIGADALEKLNASRVAVFGVGGVGGYVAEALARTGIGTIGIVDNDTVNETNINRQIIATTDTVGMNKTDAVKERILKINPECNVVVTTCFSPPKQTKLNFWITIMLLMQLTQ